MGAGSIIAITSVAIPATVLLFRGIKYLTRRAASADWQVGDRVILDYQHTSTSLTEAVQASGELPRLVGWNFKEVLYQVGDTTYREGWWSVSTNKSANWRASHRKSKRFMGKEPGFTATVNPKISRNQAGGEDEVEFFGKRIELMREVECEVNLKVAIEQEQYELAEKIRERLNGKFR